MPQQAVIIQTRETSACWTVFSCKAGSWVMFLMLLASSLYWSILRQFYSSAINSS